MPDDPYSLGDLARLADVTPRTVRYYIAQGLLPSPEAAGSATRYGEGHLARLRLIRRLQRDHLPLAEIRARLERMGDEEVVAAATALDPQQPEPSLDRDETLHFIHSLMHRTGVRPGLAEVPAVASAPPAAMRTPPAASSPVPSPAPTAPPRLRFPRSEMLMSRLSREAPDAAPEPAPDAAPGEPPASPAPSASAVRSGPDRSTWERLVISPDVELHVRRPLDRQTNKRVDQLERIARELFEDT